ncbi:MAG: phosphoserine phosphatase RsbU/P [Desulfonauticus sp.]|nr:phosphoserine phosphatase RsbU/P [Desulfonauticus sp.]
MGKKQTPLILIADDSVLNRAILASLLKDAGYHTIEANSGLEARELALKLKPDLILLDIMMPEEDGLTTCLKLKSHPLTQDIPIIFVSALNESSYVVQALEMGGVDYIVKPFSHPEILARIKVHLGLKFAREQLVEAQSDKLNRVKEMQTSLLISPKDLPQAQFDFVYYPLEEAGGDFLEVMELGEKHFLYLLGDISGHDISIAYYLSALKALCQQNFALYTSVKDSLQMINKICKSIFKEDQYFTANVILLNKNNNILQFYNCAHFPILLFREGEVKEIYGQGDVLGAFEEFFIEETIIEVDRKDRIFLFTDGLVPNDKNFRKYLDRLKNIILKHKGEDLKGICKKIFSDFWGRGDRLKDDVSLMCIEI